MEKIIAVVIMVVIVIGLIATVVMPQSEQVGQLGGEATNQMNALGSKMGGSSGADVKRELVTGISDSKLFVILDEDMDASKAQLVSKMGETKPVLASETGMLKATNTFTTGTTGLTVTVIQQSDIDNIVDTSVWERSEMKDSGTGDKYVLFVRKS